MRIARWATGLLAMLTACGPEDAVPAGFAPLCEQDGPVRVLELADDQVGYTTFRFGDRLVHEVGTFLEDRPPGKPQVDEYEIWSTGPCGESATQIARDLGATAWIAQIFDDAVVASDAEDDFFVVDPSGVHEPRLLLEKGWDYARTDSGAIMVEPTESGAARIVFLAWPADPWSNAPQPELLFDTLRQRESEFLPGTIRFIDDEVYGVDVDDRLFTLSVVDGTVTFEASGVERFEVSRERGYLMWQQVDVPATDTSPARGRVVLRDREIGTDTIVVEGELGDMAFRERIGSVGWAVVDLGGLGTSSRLISLPDLASVDVLGFDLTGVLGQFPLENGQWVVTGSTPGLESFVELLDVWTGEQTTLHTGASWLLGDDAEGLLVHELSSTAIDGPEGFAVEAPVVRIDYEGNTRRIAERATMHPLMLEGDRIVTGVDLDDDLVGDVVLVDPDRLGEHVVDRRAFFSLSHSRLLDDETIAYSVVDGPRSGIWLATPSAP